MARIQLAVNVSDIDSAVAFYSRLLDTAPAKRRPGYANFAVADPPLKLVLIAGDGAPGTLNHLGIEVEDAASVATAVAALGERDLATDVQKSVSCCYAVQDKAWLRDPDGAAWEVYAVLEDVPESPPCSCSAGSEDPGSPTAASRAEVAAATASACC